MLFGVVAAVIVGLGVVYGEQAADLLQAEEQVVSGQLAKTLENKDKVRVGYYTKGSKGYIDAKGKNRIRVGHIDEGSELHVVIRDKISLQVDQVTNGSKLHLYFLTGELKHCRADIHKVGFGGQVHIHTSQDLAEKKVEKEGDLTLHQLMLGSDAVVEVDLYKGDSLVKIHKSDQKDVEQKAEKVVK